jgi:hypothetical protein
MSADLLEWDVELILLYGKEASQDKREALSPLDWPALDSGRYLGGACVGTRSMTMHPPDERE